MKEFRKNKEGLYICEECNKNYATLAGLSKHISLNHISIKYYFNKWIKENNEGKCAICGNELPILDFKGRFNITCKNKFCVNTLRKQTNFKKYGVEYPLQDIKIQEKTKNTFLKKYGILYAFLDKEKTKKTCLKRYGTENPLQNKNIYEKQQKHAYYLKQFKNTNLWYQGLYELDFLEKNYDKYLDLQRGISIKYIFRDKNKIYHPDFFIPSLNLIIEIKSSYLIRIDKEKIEAKEKAVISNGFNYIIIIDKNYDEFYKLINNLLL